MIYELVPSELHNQLDAFNNDLEKISLQQIITCPFCEKNEFFVIRSRPTYTYRCKFCHKYSTAATHTPFNRLTPFNWLKTIFTNRATNQSYQAIAEELGCSREKVMRRDHALREYLQKQYPALYEWYKNHQQTEIPPTITQQQKIVNEKIKQILATEKPNCVHCLSRETVKVGTRTCYRCKSCRRSFNLLSNTPLNRMPRTDLWLKFIDLLVSGRTNLQIGHELQLNDNTVSKWRQSWCAMMRSWDCDALAVFCSRH